MPGNFEIRPRPPEEGRARMSTSAQWSEVKNPKTSMTQAEMMNYDVEFMQQALEEARAAAAAGEVPIGALLVRDGTIVARSGNRTLRDCDPTAHAAIIVLREAAHALGNYRLAGPTRFVSVRAPSGGAQAPALTRISRL